MIKAGLLSLALAGTLIGCGDTKPQECNCEEKRVTKANHGSIITKEEIDQAQKVWGDGIVAIGKAYQEGGDYKALATKHVKDLYAYSHDHHQVLFKPTKAKHQQFRLTEPEAISYFVTGVVPEDKGFALQPWSKVRFENAGEIFHEDSAVAMGNYFFTDANTGKEVKVEYTFEYIKIDGQLLIEVHYSGLPYH
jgi:hypothetical protein